MFADLETTFEIVSDTMKFFVLILMFTAEFLIRSKFIMQAFWTIQKHYVFLTLMSCTARFGPDKIDLVLSKKRCKADKCRSQ